MNKQYILFINLIFSLLLLPKTVLAQSKTQEARKSQKDVDLETLKLFYEKAKRYQKEKRYREARILFFNVKDMATKANVYSVMIDYRIAQCYEGEGDFENAIKHYKIYLNAKKIPKKGPDKAEIRAKIKRLQKELQTSSFPHEIQENTENNESNEIVEEDIVPPDGKKASNIDDSTSPNQKNSTTIPSNSLPNKQSPTPKSSKSMNWVTNYGMYVFVGVIATFFVVAAISQGHSFGLSNNTNNPPKGSSPLPMKQPFNNGGITVFSW